MSISSMDPPNEPVLYSPICHQPAWGEGHQWLIQHGDDPLEESVKCPPPASDSDSSSRWRSSPLPSEAREELTLLALSSPMATTASGSSLVHFAALTSNALHLVPLLVQCGAPLHLANEEGATPLHWAACNRQCPQVVPLLLQAGADALACDDLGCTALHYAAECGVVATARLLMRASPWLVDIPDACGRSALGVAIEATRYRMARALRRWGALVTREHVEAALLSGSRRMVRILLEGHETRFPRDQYEIWGRWALAHHHPRLAHYLFSLTSGAVTGHAPDC